MKDPHASALSVSQLNRLARQLLEEGFPLVSVEGEISNFACPSSGHWYFTLKDDQAQVRCALFRNRNQFLRYRPKNGDQVRLRGRVSLYEGRGEFQLIGDYLEEAGAGALQARFEALKAKLAAEGLFAAERKRPLPAMPRAIAVITSPTGAAIRDILQVLRRRCPTVPVLIYPAAVQGEEAPAQLRRALQLANNDDRCDLVIIGRGGGSAEDLAAFNDEALARAIAASRLPVISAVGHETDFTICDFVADLRAPTPSAAAELAAPDLRLRLAEARRLHTRLLAAVLRLLRVRQERLRLTAGRLRHPGQKLQQQSQQLDRLELALKRRMAALLERHHSRLDRLRERLARTHPERQIDKLRERTALYEHRLGQVTEQLLAQRRQRLITAVRTLNALNPLATLERGYAIVESGRGIVRSWQEVAPGEEVSARLGHGGLRCQVLETLPPDPEES